jgi:hypothetical protein
VTVEIHETPASLLPVLDREVGAQADLDAKAACRAWYEGPYQSWLSDREDLSYGPEPTYRKADARYYVEVDGHRVGWVHRDVYSTYGVGTRVEWVGYVSAPSSLEGTRVVKDSTRRGAAQEVVTTIAIRGWA